MKRMAMVACAAVLSLASVSFADLAKIPAANGVFAGTTTGTAGASSINSANLGNIDNVTGITLTGGASGGTIQVDFVLTDPATGPQGETPFLLWATTASGASLTALTIGTGSSGTFSAISSATPAPNLVLVGGGVTNRFAGVYTGAIPTYTTFRATFTLGIGATLAIDMVSNPEPGTWALFAFGLAGMGAFAWRRRNAAKLALAKSAS